MKKTIPFIMISMILILSACSKSEEKSPAALVLSEINGNVLWERISMEAEYTTYTFWKDHGVI